MFIFRLWNYLRGYVIIKLNSANYEKIINLLKRKNITTWDIIRHETGISFKVSYDDYTKNTTLFENINSEIPKKIGVLINCKKLEKRTGFIIGIILFAICIAVFTSYIWDIEIVGNTNINNMEIIEILKNNNINTPMRQRAVNEKNIEVLLHRSFNQLKFVEAYIEGSKLVIFIKEKKPQNIYEKDDEPCSIVATKDAIINYMITKRGQPVVENGSVVYKGQTLIMGIIQNEEGKSAYVSSLGNVYGKTYYSFQYRESKRQTMTICTNKESKIYFLKINDKKIKIIGDTEPFQNYNYKESIIEFPLVSGLTNTAVVEGKYYEQKTEERDIDNNFAQDKMKIKMYDELAQKCSNDSKVFNTSIDFTEDDEYYYLNAKIELIEDIGAKVKLFVPNEEEQ